MPLIKMTSRTPKSVDRDDIVVRKALQLSLTPEMVFVQAYAESGNEQSTGERQFRSVYYPGTDGRKFKIPKVVQRFCESPMPTCRYDGCNSHHNPDKKPPYTVVLPRGLIAYYCSQECRDTDAENRNALGDVSQSDKKRMGDLVFRRISEAMSRSTLETVPEELVRAMPGQPRKFFDPSRLQSLSESMVTTLGGNDDPNATGQLMPGLVRRIPADENGCTYELLDGERRLKAVRMAGIKVYRALVIDLDSESSRSVMSVMANFNREGHTPLEMADTIANLHDEFGFSFQKIADTIGKSMGRVRDMYSLKKLRPEVRAMLDPEQTQKKKRLSVGAAIQIAELTESRQLSEATKAIEDGLRITEVRERVHRYTGGGVTSSRGLTQNQRLKQFRAQIRRVSPAMTLLASAVKLSADEDVFDLLGEDELQAARETLAEAMDTIDTCAKLLEKPPQKILRTAS